MAAPQPLSRADFHDFQRITTRWADNDVYGHVNNVTYYAWFDSAVNRYMIEQGGLDIHTSPEVAYVVNSHCDYFAPLAYPQNVEAGLRIARLGRSSIQWEIGIFAEGAEHASAQGQLVHVFVDQQAQASVAIPATVREALERLVHGA